MSDNDYIKTLEADNDMLREKVDYLLLNRGERLVAFNYEHGCRKIHISFSQEALQDVVSEFGFDGRKILHESLLAQMENEVKRFLDQCVAEGKIHL
jgi:hypothetical protein